MNLSLENKNAVICGSTQGIGFAIAQELAMQGANCTLFARNEETLKAALLHLDTSLQQKHHYHVADFSNPADVKAAIQKHVAETEVHILINNSGGPAAGPIVDASEEQFLNTFNQHLVCNHILTTAVIPAMKAAGYGRVINIISTSVKIPLKNLGVSNTIRGAVASWAKTMANELAEFGITVNNILPGATKTQRLENIISNNANKKQVTTDEAEAEMLKEIPAKRFGEPEELAALAAFLASPSAGYINGVSIPVDGGRTGSI